VVVPGCSGRFPMVRRGLITRGSSRVVSESYIRPLGPRVQSPSRRGRQGFQSVIDTDFAVQRRYHFPWVLSCSLMIVAAMRSPSGASAAILRAVCREKVQLLLSVPLAMEYEAVCLRAEHQIAARLSEQDVHIFVDAVIAMAEPVKIHFLWRPQLRNPSDEMVLETAVNGRANLLVTFNVRDYGTVPERFGIQVTTPRQAMERIGK